VSIEEIPANLRVDDLFHHIDMGFLNRRLCLTALPNPARAWYIEHQKPGSDHMTVLSNDHLLVTVLLDACQAMKVPSLLQALALGEPRHLFRSTERLAPCPDLYEAARVDHEVELDLDFGKPVRIGYHTKHLVSDTGRMTLAEGAPGGYVHAMVGVLHNKSDRFQIEPFVIGSPWFDHPRNNADSGLLMFIGRDFGEILPEDIDQFSRMKHVQAETTDEWLKVMQSLPEAFVKNSFARLLSEPTKKDWGGELNDHFSSNVSIGGRRKTAAFLLKGPAVFREMTLEMCGHRADQIHRLVDSGADVSIVQHCHQIGEVVRRTLRTMTVYPGERRKYCLIDGQATYRILKAYSLLPGSNDHGKKIGRRENPAAA
jgi:hypothetical protein